MTISKHYDHQPTQMLIIHSGLNKVKNYKKEYYLPLHFLRQCMKMRVTVEKVVHSTYGTN